MKKLMSGILVGAMTLSMAGMAFADQVHTMDKTKFDKAGFTQEQRQEKMKEIFDQVVQKGIISQDQMDKLLEKRNNDKYTFHKGNKEDMKNVTPEEREAKQADRKAKMEEKIKEAVESGKMTQEQADKFAEKKNNDKKDFHKGTRPNKENKEDMKNATPEEREAKRAERKAKMEEKIKEAVENGKMTQEQADKHVEKMKTGDTFKMKRSPVGGILKKGVEEGTITQEQADESIKIINENRVK
ncbi:hypothetical protein IZY60_10955 [Lutibacter sp. B2]|nr:hypothetical protein [Lutibacter sp. B2]